MNFQTYRNGLWVLLFPISLVWGIATSLRRRIYPSAWRYRSQLPVLCVGNLHAGGTGKSPIVAEIANHFRDRGLVVLSRGYRRNERSLGLLDPSLGDRVGAAKYGDEPWMLAKRLKLPVFVGASRKRALRTLETLGQFQRVVMDDGFQHLRVSPQVSLIVVSADANESDHFLLPLGDLREPVSAIHSASAVVVTGVTESVTQIEFWRRAAGNIPVFFAKRMVEGLHNGTGAYAPESEERLGGFCAIARPSRFAHDLRETFGGPMVAQFGDHHFYTDAQVGRLIEKRHDRKMTRLVTTEKDYYKVRDFFAARSEPLLYLRIGYQLPDDCWRFLETAWVNG